MPVVNVTVSELRPPAVGKKRGRIVASDNTLYQAAPELLGKMATGQNYNIVYKDETYGELTYRVAESAVPSGPSPSVAPAGRPPAPQQARYGSTDMPTAERIFVCGALNAILANANTDPSKLSVASLVVNVNLLRQTWLNTFGGGTSQAGAQPPPATTAPVSLKDEMNEEIPF